MYFTLALLSIVGAVWGPGSFWYWLIAFVIFCTLAGQKESKCPSCKEGSLESHDEDDEILNVDNVTKKVKDREYTKDMRGNKISYTDKTSYVNETIVTKRIKFKCNKCDYCEYNEVTS